MKVKVGIANRHAHLSKEVADVLFGENYKFTEIRELSQTGQYAYNETITIKSNKSSFENVRIIGPLRPYTQVEITKTDSFSLGLKPPVRDSGDIKGSEPITLIGPEGEVSLEEGCIIANRHIHLTVSDYSKYNLEGIDIVSIRVGGEKGGILDNVHLKIDDSYVFELHLDTDDANSHLINQGDLVEIIKK